MQNILDFYTTVWKFQNFLSTQILREIIYPIQHYYVLPEYHVRHLFSILGGKTSLEFPTAYATERKIQLEA